LKHPAESIPCKTHGLNFLNVIAPLSIEVHNVCQKIYCHDQVVFQFAPNDAYDNGFAQIAATRAIGQSSVVFDLNKIPERVKQTVAGG
jgi:hypothetical protein